MFRALDVDDNGVLTRRELLLVTRHDRKLCDAIRFPLRVRQGDATFAHFNAKFLTMNEDKLGHVNMAQFIAYMRTARPPPSSEASKITVGSQPSILKT